MKFRNFLVSMPVVIALSVGAPPDRILANETHRLVNFSGDWKFQMGDNPRWADPKYDDKKWSDIYAPSTWEDEGYPGYDGYAWYRLHFDASSDWESADLVLELGKIDDIDETYINGHLVGASGTFPPTYNSAYNEYRRYPLPYGFLKPGEDNVIAVRIYDSGGPGGIVDGRVGIYEIRYYVEPDIRIPAGWKFRTGDDLKWKDASYDDKDWKSVNVPAYWESQGFQGYDGYAWYRVRFKVPASLADRDLIVLVGKIDDYDEVYLNGERIGRTGLMPKNEVHRTESDDYSQSRAYMIPPGSLKRDGENVLAVRVFDCWQGGGIYEGPIGIVSREHYARYHRAIRHFGDWIQDIIDRVFH